MKKTLFVLGIIGILVLTYNCLSAAAEEAETWPHLNLQDRVAKKVAQCIKDGIWKVDVLDTHPPKFRRQIAKEYYFLNNCKTDGIPVLIRHYVPTITLQDEIHHGIFPKIRYTQVGHILSLSHKNLHDLSILQKIPGIQRVKWLYLDNNAIGTLEAHSFAHMPNLEMISLKGNRIHTVEDEAFAGIRFLMEIDVDSQLTEQPNLLAQMQKNSPSTRINLHSAE